MKYAIIPYIYNSKRRLLALLFCLLSMPALLPAANEFGYTDQHPLVIVGDWDFRPFEFINVEARSYQYIQ